MTDDIKDTAGIAFVGFGEAAQAFVSGWDLASATTVTAYDIKTDDPMRRAAMMARYEGCAISGRVDLAEALRPARVVFSLVTADQALHAARAAAPLLGRGALWLDGNSCAPDTKRSAAEAIEAAGGRYVDMAVMAPVHPARHKVPLLLSGAEAEAAAGILAGLGMRPRVIGAGVGEASAVKMIRSVMIKGLEALSAECFLAARRAGVEAEVLASLQASDPAIDWRGRGAYNLERMMLHGTRRAAEMREVAATVAALGLPDHMSAATTLWQDRIGAAGLDAGADNLADRADRIMAAL